MKSSVVYSVDVFYFGLDNPSDFRFWRMKDDVTTRHYHKAKSIKRAQQALATIKRTLGETPRSCYGAGTRVTEEYTNIMRFARGYTGEK